MRENISNAYNLKTLADRDILTIRGQTQGHTVFKGMSRYVSQKLDQVGI